MAIQKKLRHSFAIVTPLFSKKGIDTLFCKNVGENKNMWKLIKIEKNRGYISGYIEVVKMAYMRW
jgi:hypothetical protein